MSFRCPRCFDQYTQSLAMVYNAGRYQWTNHRGLARGNQTASSRLASPPQRGVPPPVDSLRLFGGVRSHGGSPAMPCSFGVPVDFEG
jgi:hypothetical protein